jgi:hypothetical protein
LTRNGVFGINCDVHGVRLCTVKSRTYRLNEHFRRFHQLTASAALALTRAIDADRDSTSTRLFHDEQTIVNVDERRRVACPIRQSFVHYPTLNLINCPCDRIQSIGQLKNHLKRSHRFSEQAATILVKAFRTARPIPVIEFPRWINILQHDQHENETDAFLD